MTDATKAAGVQWITDFIKQVGFPIALCAMLIYVGYQFTNQDRQNAREDSVYTREVLTRQLDATNTVLRAIERELHDSNETRRQLNTTMERLGDK